MTKTYGEIDQAICFKAARDLYSLAADILDDLVLDTELLGQTYQWACLRAETTYRRGEELEEKGHEFTVATARQTNDLYKARARYHAAWTLAGIRRDRAEAAGIV